MSDSSYEKGYQDYAHGRPCSPPFECPADEEYCRGWFDAADNERGK